MQGLAKTLGLAAVLVGLNLATSAQAASAYTVGYVDTAKILLQMPGAQTARQQMQAELIEYQKAFADRQRRIAEATQAKKPEAEIRRMTEQFEKELAPLKAKAQGLEMRLSGQVKTKVEAAIQAIARARRLDVVLDKAAVLYGGVDITNEVLTRVR